MKRATMQDHIDNRRSCWLPDWAELNGEIFEPVYTWAHLVPNCTRAEMHRRLWYWNGKKKHHIPRGICFDTSRMCVMYPRDGGVVLARGWNGANYSHRPRAMICGRVRYGKCHPQVASYVPPLTLDGQVYYGDDRTEHLKAILNGLAQLCRDTLAGKRGFMKQDAVEDFGYALYHDYTYRNEHHPTREECDFRARIVVTAFLDWYEGWTAAGQPVEPEVED